jgi:hypothetical protein
MTLFSTGYYLLISRVRKENEEGVIKWNVAGLFFENVEQIVLCLIIESYFSNKK